MIQKFVSIFSKSQLTTSKTQNTEPFQILLMSEFDSQNNLGILPEIKEVENCERSSLEQKALEKLIGISDKEKLIPIEQKRSPRLLSIQERKTTEEKRLDVAQIVVENVKKRNAIAEKPQITFASEKQLAQENFCIVQKIHAQKIQRRKLLYLIEWKGLPKRKDFTWEPLSSIEHLEEELNDFETRERLTPQAKIKKKGRPFKNLRSQCFGVAKQESLLKVERDQNKLCEQSNGQKMMQQEVEDIFESEMQIQGDYVPQKQQKQQKHQSKELFTFIVHPQSDSLSPLQKDFTELDRLMGCPSVPHAPVLEIIEKKEPPLTYDERIKLRIKQFENRFLINKDIEYLKWWVRGEEDLMAGKLDSKTKVEAKAENQHHHQKDQIKRKGGRHS